MKCYTLFDSGSTTNAISPDAAIVAKAPLVELDEPVTLQLGTVGSRSTINYGTHVRATLGSSVFTMYYDIANIDYYNVVLGIPFMLQNKVKLDFENKTVQVNGGNHHALSLEQEKTARRQRCTFRRQIDEAILYGMDKPPASRQTSYQRNTPKERYGSKSVDKILASDIAAPPTAPPPSVSPHLRVFGNCNVTVEEVAEGSD